MVANEKLTGYDVPVINIRDYAMPIYGINHETQDGFPYIAKQLKAQFTHVDAFIFAIPEHNG
jgi:NAD(P)H-dependent FMN reductase